MDVEDHFCLYSCVVREKTNAWTHQHGHQRANVSRFGPDNGAFSKAEFPEHVWILHDILESICPHFCGGRDSSTNECANVHVEGNIFLQMQRRVSVHLNSKTLAMKCHIRVSRCSSIVGARCSSEEAGGA